LLAFTKEVDEEIAVRTEIAIKNVEAVLQADDVRQALEQNIGAVDEYFMQAVTQSLEKARKEGDLDHSSRLQQIMDIINELSSPPEEIKLIEKFLEISDDEIKLKSTIDEHGEDITTELIQMVNVILTQTLESVKQAKGKEKEEQEEVLSRLQPVYDAILGYSMRRSMNSG